MKRYFKCEIKTTSRCQQVTVNKEAIAFEPNHLNGWLIHSGMKHRHCLETQNSAVAVFGTMCWRIRAKTGNMVSKTQVS